MSCDTCSEFYRCRDCGEELVPSPTWRPIAELPAEWRDGRTVRLGDADGNEYVCSWFPGPACDEWRPGGWEIWTGDEFARLTAAPTHYLDLAIQEAPR